MQQLVEDSFGEDKEIEKPKSDSKEASSDVSSSSIAGFPASPGIAIGSVIPYQPLIPEVVAQKIENSQQEWENLQLAIQTAKGEIEKLASKDDTGIFEAHLLFLEDPAWIDRARKLIFESNYSAAVAWKLIIEDTIAAYQSLEDPYLQNRVTDVTDVGMRVVRLLLGVDRPSIDLPQPGILVAYD
ncbi:MAG: phosphoenolpyruvate-utilizing N-terminal domain-containing protein, partial [Prochloraceae cyanobacterium]|nr:phosphoenolpyruvate-utilizing N-terminal domain-containing protein [Prochloraceae cyanobacterium]